MKRIQIIFLFLIALTVLSVISDREDSNYYSEYNTRFTCGLKYDFTLLHIGHELKQSNNQKELSAYTVLNAATTGSQQNIVKHSSNYLFDLPPAKRDLTEYRNEFEIFNLKTLIPSRAPPSFS